MSAEKNTRRYKSIPITKMLKPTTIYDPDPVKKLSKELLYVYEKVRLTDAERDSRMHVFKRYKRMIEEELDCVVEIYGSTKTMTMVYDSDIDITVLVRSKLSGTGHGAGHGTEARGDANDLDKKHYDSSRDFAHIYLSKICKIIESSKSTRGPVLYIKKARVPILKFTDKFYGYKVDISLNKVDGIQGANYIIAQMVERPYMKYFIILLKYFLKRRTLGDASFGGLCAYGQFLMILNFVQLHPLIQNGNISVEENIGTLFLDFFQFFGIDFPYERSTISVKEVCYKPNNLGNICIEDPIIEGSNVTGACTSIHFIKDIFIYSYKVMVAALSQKVDPKKGVSELWLRLDPKEMKTREKLSKIHK